jgi:hypothetical protein
MRRSTAMLRHRGNQDAAQQRVAEPVGRPRRRGDSGFLRLGQHPEQVVLVDAGDRRQVVERAAVADERRHLQQLAGRGPDASEAWRARLSQLGRDRQLDGARVGERVALADRQSRAQLQLLDDQFGEQRVARRRVEDRGQKCGAREGVAPGGQQRVHLELVQSGQPHPTGDRLATEAAEGDIDVRIVDYGAAGEDDEHSDRQPARRLAQRRHQVVEEPERAGVGPMHVVDRQHDGPMGGGAHEASCHREVYPHVRVVPIELARRIDEHVGHAGERLDGCGDGQERRRHVLERRTDQHPGPAVAHLCRPVMQQSALADPGVAGDQREARMTVGDLLQPTVEQHLLVGASRQHLTMPRS